MELLQGPRHVGIAEQGNPLQPCGPYIRIDIRRGMPYRMDVLANRSAAAVDLSGRRPIDTSQIPVVEQQRGTPLGHSPQFGNGFANVLKMIEDIQ